MAKKKKEVRVSFVGANAYQVTGSMILIETDNRNILLECGLSQSSSSIMDYKENAKSFPFKPKNIDYVFVNHCHIDHVGRLPKLVKDGFEGKIITTEITAKLLKPMLLDTANIIKRDAEYISKKRGYDYEPFFNEDDVVDTLYQTYEYDYDKVYELDDNISFKFLHNAHLIGACQLELYIKTASGNIERILYTSDLKGDKNKNHYVHDTEYCTKANLVITECTYGETKKNYKSDRKKDLEKIKTVVNQVCLMDRGRILIPVFSLSRSQEILTNLYELFGNDDGFNIPIIMDSPLIWEITNVYKKCLRDENKELFDKVCNWKNVKFIKDFNESKTCLNDESPKIVLSSSGFLHKGRSVRYLQEFISNVKDHLLFVGYAPEGSIAARIKNGQKTISIEGKTYKNKCGITILNSFSSHISQKELLDYMKNIICERIALVHADEESKLEFKAILEEELSNLGKTTKVIAVNKGTSFGL